MISVERSEDCTARSKTKDGIDGTKNRVVYRARLEHL